MSGGYRSHDRNRQQHPMQYQGQQKEPLQRALIKPASLMGQGGAAWAIHKVWAQGYDFSKRMQHSSSGIDSTTIELTS
jgi:hypothetical protein